MLKNNIFDRSRFISFLMKDLMENWKSNLLRVVSMYGLIVLIFFFNNYFTFENYSPANLYVANQVESFGMVLFMWCLWGFGCVSASLTFERMKSKTGKISMLMTPVTSFEKYLVRWFLMTILFLVVFLLVYKLADYTRVLFFSLLYPDIDIIKPISLLHLVGDSNEYWSLFTTNSKFLCMVSGYLLFQSFFVLGSAFWPKNAFLKTFATLLIILFIYVSTAMLVNGKIMNNQSGELGYLMSFSGDQIILGVTIFSFALALMNWVIAYFRFKESEVINRM